MDYEDLSVELNDGVALITLNRPAELHHHLKGKADAAEGPVAYLERRAPRWVSSVAEDWPEWLKD